uniref:Uncharacterized protein n=1 Tax=Ananas comosus var. bracteatus TaxID=296719 RepID=A0A6V7Q5C0_ANACO|nr:unnamed protein product [Ananas comosus var. bracteatus]
MPALLLDPLIQPALPVHHQNSFLIPPSRAVASDALKRVTMLHVAGNRVAASCACGPATRLPGVNFSLLRSAVTWIPDPPAQALDLSLLFSPPEPHLLGMLIFALEESESTPFIGCGWQ